MIGYEQKLARVLDRMGGIYILRDILDRIKDGRMQAFVRGNSMLVTQINCFPRAKALDVVVAIGDLDDCRELHDEALAFADKENISLIRAYGRRGWMPDARDHGWRLVTVNQVYMKEL
jgi:hypothetical protein